MRTFTIHCNCQQFTVFIFSTLFFYPLLIHICNANYCDYIMALRTTEI